MGCLVTADVTGPGVGVLAALRANTATLEYRHSTSVFEDEAGFSMTPPVARTWGRRGHTPVIRVRGRSRRRTSVAALCCYKPGESGRLIHRPRGHLLLKGARKSFSWQDYRDLLVRAHIQLDGPIVVVWDNLALIWQPG